MEKIAFSKIANALGVSIDLDIEITDISTDTRTIKKNSLFIALKGDNFDGADYIDDAFSLGASVCITQKDIKYNGKGVLIVVENTIKALQDIAFLYRKQFDVNTVAITGSVGKTSTKEMVFAVLNGFDKTLKTQGNLNNEIGVPKTLLQLESDHKNAVIEMGMSNLFEIEELSYCAEPNIAIITNIGNSHIENLKTQDGIFKAKSEIVSGLKQNGFLILNGDDEILMNNKNVFKHKVFTYGIKNKDCDIVAFDIKYDNENSYFKVIYLNKTYNCTIKCIGEHNVLNALAGILVGVLSKYNIEKCCEYIKNFKNTGMRQNVVKKSGVTIIEDCYNASVDSMKASINVLDIISTSGKKIAVLGDMLENGVNTEQYHAEVGKSIKNSNIDILFTYGNYAENIKKFSSLKNSTHFYSKNDLLNKLKNVLLENDVILFKASRGMKLEDIIFDLYKFLDEK